MAVVKGNPGLVRGEPFLFSEKAAHLAVRSPNHTPPRFCNLTFVA